MSSIYGKNIKVSIFGESHGVMLGVTLNGIKPGVKLDIDFIKKEVARRKPIDILSTPRKEADEFEIVSGYFNGYTTGAPLTIVSYNKNTISKNYDKNIMRPSHADYTANVKYNGFQDYRGGGHFSGRITLLVVIAGAICKQVLNHYNIEIKSHIKNIGNVYDDDLANYEEFNNDLLTVSEDKLNKMKEVIVAAKNSLDSVGGSIEACICGVPAGLGEPFFDSVESVLSYLLFSIPAVKAVEFGLGKDFNSSYGSMVNDEFTIINNKVVTKTNNNGGINGGISNGMPIVVTASFKPTPSISKKQNTIDIEEMENVEYEINGRHDPCIVIRAKVVVESMLAIGILDLLMDSGEYYD